MEERDLLGNVLIENHFLTEEQLEAAIEKQKASPEHKPLGQILIEEGYITQRALDTILSIQQHRSEMREKKVEESADEATARRTAMDPVVIGGLKREIRQLKQEIEKLRTELKHEIMQDVKRYVQQQVKRAKRR